VVSPEKDECPTDPIGIPALRLVPGADDHPIPTPAEGETKEKNKKGKGKGKKKHAKGKKKGQGKKSAKQAAAKEESTPEEPSVLELFGLGGVAKLFKLHRRRKQQRKHARRDPEMDRFWKLARWGVLAFIAIAIIVNLAANWVHHAGNIAYNNSFDSCMAGPNPDLLRCDAFATKDTSWIGTLAGLTIALCIIWIVVAVTLFVLYKRKDRLPAKINDWTTRTRKWQLWALAGLTAIAVILLIISSVAIP